MQLWHPNFNHSPLIQYTHRIRLFFHFILVQSVSFNYLKYVLYISTPLVLFCFSLCVCVCPFCTISIAKQESWLCFDRFERGEFNEFEYHRWILKNAVSSNMISIESSRFIAAFFFVGVRRWLTTHVESLPSQTYIQPNNLCLWLCYSSIAFHSLLLPWFICDSIDKNTESTMA